VGFPVSSRRTAYIASKPQRCCSKTQRDRFAYKSGFCWKNICYNVSLCEKIQWQSWKAFSGLSNIAQMVGGRRKCSSSSEAPVGVAAVLTLLSRNLTNTPFALQWLEFSMKLLTMSINWTNWGVWMHYMITDYGR